MKIRLDENLSPRVGRAIQAIVANRSGWEVSHACDRDGGAPDPLWLRSFAEEGGTVVISGDSRILQNWPDLIAYRESGLIAFFPPAEFGSRLKGHARAAFILRWWTCIIERARVSDRGDCWRIPMSWTPSIDRMIAIDDPRLRSNPQLIEASAAGRGRRMNLSGDGRQVKIRNSKPE